MIHKISQIFSFFSNQYQCAVKINVLTIYKPKLDLFSYSMIKNFIYNVTYNAPNFYQI